MADTGNIYKELQQHLDKQAVGFPATKTGVEINILKELFTPEQVPVALRVSVEPKSAKQVYAELGATELTLEKTTHLLDEMVINGAITLEERDGTDYFFTMPLLVGVIEKHGYKATPQFWRNFGAYMAGEYGKDYANTNVSQMRTIPVQKSITVEHRVTTYDDIREVIMKTEDPIIISQCMCRESANARGNPCKKTHRKETCMTFGEWAKLGVRGGAKPISKEQALEIMRLNQEDGLVLQPNNYEKVDFVCACCGCCCGILVRQKNMPAPAVIWAHNYYAAVDADTCAACGACVDRCQVNALKIDEQSSKAVINLERCIGCGNCVVTCPTEALKLVKKEKETTPPADAPALYKMLRKKER
jgi:Na+-translocating ferredoxin:NAD+ oxidoreductase subunit B